eukprot:1133646-Pelagomonas_calceolata.AAC.2
MDGLMPFTEPNSLAKLRPSLPLQINQMTAAAFLAAIHAVSHLIIPGNPCRPSYNPLQYLGAILFLAGCDQPRADQPNHLAEGHPPLKPNLTQLQHSSSTPHPQPAFNSTL